MTSYAPAPANNGNRTALIVVGIVVVILLCCCPLSIVTGYFSYNRLQANQEKAQASQPTAVESANKANESTPATSNSSKPEVVDPTSNTQIDPTAEANSSAANFAWTPPTPGSLENMPKTTIELAKQNEWFHRVYDPRKFNAKNGWSGADSWYLTYAYGPNAGGNWTSMGNPAQVVYRAESTETSWSLAILTTEKYKEQFLNGAQNMPIALNVRITPNTLVYIKTHDGKVVSQETSDGGDLCIILPNNGITTIWTKLSTAANTFETLIWAGPYDRSENINTVDAR